MNRLVPTLDQAVADIAAQSPYWAGVVDLAATGHRGAVIELAGKVRKVKTAKGAEFYGLPIGSPIVKKGGKAKDHHDGGSSSSPSGSGGSSSSSKASSSSASTSSSSSKPGTSSTTSPSSSADAAGKGPATPQELMAAVKAAPKTSGTAFPLDQRAQALLKALQLAGSTKHPHKIYVDKTTKQIKVTKQKNLPPEGQAYALVRYTGKATNVDAEGNQTPVPHQRVADLLAPHLGDGTADEPKGDADTPSKAAAKPASAPAEPAQAPQDAPAEPTAPKDTPSATAAADAPPEPAPAPSGAAPDSVGDTSTPAGLMVAAKATDKVPGLVFPPDQVGLASLKALQLAGSTKHPHKLYYDDAGQIRITKQKNVPPPGTPHSLVRYTGKAWDVDSDGNQTPLTHADLVAMVGPHLAAPSKDQTPDDVPSADALAGPLSAGPTPLNSASEVQAPDTTPEPAPEDPQAELHANVLESLDDAAPNPQLLEQLAGADDVVNAAEDLSHQLASALLAADASGEPIYVVPMTVPGWEMGHVQTDKPTPGQTATVAGPGGKVVGVGEDGSTFPIEGPLLTSVLGTVPQDAVASKTPTTPDVPDEDGPGAPGASLAAQAALVNTVPTDSTDLASLVVAGAQTEGFGQGLPIGIVPEGDGKWTVEFVGGAGGYELQPDGTLEQVGVGPVSQDLLDALVASAAAKHGYLPAVAVPPDPDSQSVVDKAKQSWDVKVHKGGKYVSEVSASAMQKAIADQAPHYVWSNDDGKTWLQSPTKPAGDHYVLHPDGTETSVQVDEQGVETSTQVPPASVLGFLGKQYQKSISKQAANKATVAAYEPPTAATPAPAPTPAPPAAAAKPKPNPTGSSMDDIDEPAPVLDIGPVPEGPSVELRYGIDHRTAGTVASAPTAKKTADTRAKKVWDPVLAGNGGDAFGGDHKKITAASIAGELEEHYDTDVKVRDLARRFYKGGTLHNARYVRLSPVGQPVRANPGEAGAAEYGTPEWRTVMLRGIAGDTIRTWSGTSNDASPISLALQNAATREFGITNPAPWKTTPELDANIAEHEARLHDLFARVLVAQYWATQRRLAELNITELRLMRGYRWGHSGTARPEWSKTTGAKDVPQRPMQSWSSSSKIAKSFSGGGGHNSTLIIADIPAEKILGFPTTGYGCLNEYEFVLLGNSAATVMSAG